MRVKLAAVACVMGIVVSGAALWGQDLGPHFRKVKEGVYVQTAQEGNSNCGIILTSEGVVLVDSGHNPTDSREILAAVRRLTDQPVRYVINTETHGDHSTGNWIFSPQALVINSDGATRDMLESYNPDRIETLRSQSDEMREAAEGYRLVTPHIEYSDKMTLRLGGKVIEILHLDNVHSGADSAVWLPEDRVLFAASAAGPRRLNNIRPTVRIADIRAALKMMKDLNPEIVVPGHGAPTTAAMFDESERYYQLLFERIEAMIRQRKTLDQIKEELKMPEYASWANQDRLANNIEIAYRDLRGGD